MDSEIIEISILRDGVASISPLSWTYMMISFHRKRKKALCRTYMVGEVSIVWRIQNTGNSVTDDGGEGQRKLSGNKSKQR